MELRTVKAVITGGASGLGRATAAHFVTAGGQVSLLDRPSSAGAEVAKSLGPAAIFTPADVTSAEEVTAALETAAVLAPQLELLLYRTVEVQSGHQLFFLSSRLVCSPGMWTGGGMSLSRQPPPTAAIRFELAV